jgi:hypothetical protein
LFTLNNLGARQRKRGVEDRVKQRTKSVELHAILPKLYVFQYNHCSKPGLVTSVYLKKFHPPFFPFPTIILDALLCGFALSLPPRISKAPHDGHREIAMCDYASISSHESWMELSLPTSVALISLPLKQSLIAATYKRVHVRWSHLAPFPF